MTPKHTISINVHGVEIVGWESYDITVSMTEVPARFTLQIRYTREAWDALVPDRAIRVMIDRTPVITGIIEDSPLDESGQIITVTGRCKLSRLVTESAPSISFQGLGIKEMFQALAHPWFSSVALSNARNRTIARGKGRKARAESEPIKINTRVGTLLEPGQTRWVAADKLLDQAGYLAWSSGDGRELVIGKPNYEQEVQFSFSRGASDSNVATNVKGMAIGRSTGDRYSRIICVGDGKGTEVNYGSAVTSRYGEAKNNPATVDGEGKDFSFPKRLIIVRKIHSNAHAAELAEQEMAARDAGGATIDVRVGGHGQFVGSTQQPTIFVPDTLAYVLDARTGTRGIYTIDTCNYRGSRAGQETVMKIVKKGTELRR